MKNRLLFCFLFAVCHLNAQTKKPPIHAPADIFKIMSDSKVSYGIRILDSAIPAPDRRENLNFNDVYRVGTKNGFATRSYKVNDLAKKSFEKAEEYFAANDLISARLFYKKAVETDTGFYKPLTYIGQTYGIEGNTDEAIKYYRLAIAKNSIDYMAHWFLADMYSMKKQYDLALEEILTAHILNRNNPRIIDAMKVIVSKNKKEYSPWVFNPQYSLHQFREDSIEIAMSPLWMAYANAKAMWEYEPGFKESMGFKKDQKFIQADEKDALLGLITLSKSDKKVSPTEDVKAAERAIEKGYITEFIFYEIYLPQMPAIAYQLPESMMESMKQYIRDIRLK